MSALSELLSEAKPGPWRWDPGQEDDFEVPPVMWFRNAEGDSLLVQVEDVVALLSLAMSLRPDRCSPPCLAVTALDAGYPR